MALKTYIYSLKDPITKEIRYIGKSNNPERRLLAFHIPQARLKRTHKECWIYSLIKNNQCPIIEILEETDNEHWSEREKYHINYYRELGCDLVNGTNGGESFNFTNDIKEKISKSLINHPIRSKPICQFDEYGNKINEFPSIAEASRKTKIPGSNICKALKGYIRISGNYYWSYKDEDKTFITKPTRWISVYQMDNNNNVINKFDTIKSASQSINRDLKTISAALNNPRRTAGSYKWMTEDYYNSIQNM